MSVGLDMGVRSMLIIEILGEINAENFTGKLPNRTQSDYSRNLNCKY